MLRGKCLPGVFRAFDCDHNLTLRIPAYKGVMLKRQTESFLPEEV